MGSSNGKCRRPNGLLKEKNGCNSLYALCGNKPSSVFYSKSLENCSLKLYRVEGENPDHEDVVVMLDCGGRVYANGKKVYPFDNLSDGLDETNVSQIIGELSNGRIPDVFGPIGNKEKHVNPGDYAGALDSLLNIIAETFNQLLMDGLKMQEGMRILEEEKTHLSLKVLELKKEQLHSQKLELEKKKLELRVEELEASLSLQSGMFLPPMSKTASLCRSRTIGIGDGRSNGSYLRNVPKRTGSFRKNGDSEASESDTDGKNSKSRLHPRHKVVARLKELEAEREKISHQSSLLQFQLDALTAQQDLAQSKVRVTTSGHNGLANGKGPESPPKGKSRDRPSIEDSPEKLSTSYNGSSLSTSPLSASSVTGSTHGYTNGFGGSDGSGDEQFSHVGSRSVNEPTVVSAANHNSASKDVSREHRFKTRENSWEKYDTLKKRYEDLKKKRAQRLQQGGLFVSQDDMTSSPALQQRTTQITTCSTEVGLEGNQQFSIADALLTGRSLSSGD